MYKTSLNTVFPCIGTYNKKIDEKDKLKKELKQSIKAELEKTINDYKSEITSSIINEKIKLLNKEL